MKSTLLFLIAALSLGACQKSTVDPAIAPQDFGIDFSRDFALHYQQQASLPTATSPELTVRLDEVKYSYCPEAVTCVVGSMAWPVLTITDAQGHKQQLSLPHHGPRPYSAAWLDTTSVRANGRRYLLTYTLWEIERTLDKQEMPVKQDFALWFTVAAAANK
ncbi:hypothetical protein [Hymenobacter lucidus]|uniref:Lipoprotein n=1 Tax=Hymenobacter lucidus TaxID=2880930 RepID=A0ABS8ARB1_9BACT|nr:hypothetical protein [Hymenobacter lucidus]MCB2408765.1 hypothetical protein [Hymenobacter lucidus]